MTTNLFPDLRHIIADVGNGNMGVHGQFGLYGNNQRQQSKGNRTYVEDKKDPVELQLPSGNRLLIILRMEKSRNCVLPTLFDDLPLDLCCSPAIKNVVGELPGSASLV